MIEKLDTKMDCVEITLLGRPTECLGFDSAKAIGHKINELVQAINELQDRVERLFDPTEIANQFHALSMAIKHLTERVEKLEKEHIADPSKKMPKAELIEDYGYDLAEAVEECGDLFKKGPIEPVTITDVFNEMGRLYADLWNKMEDIHYDLKNKGGDND